MRRRSRSRRWLAALAWSALALAGCGASPDPLPRGADVGWEDRTAAAGLAGVTGRCATASFADLDGDGAPDLVLGGGGLRVYRNDGHGRFSPWVSLQLPADGGSDRCGIAVADLDGDGRLDVMEVGATSQLQLAVYYNDGGGAFTPQLLDASDPPGTSRFTLGAYELAVAGAPGERPIVYLGRTYLDVQGDDLRTFRYAPDGIAVECRMALPAPTSLAFRAAPLTPRRLERLHDPVVDGMRGLVQGLAAADLDGDGRDDLLVALDFSRQVALRNTPGGFQDVSAAWGVDRFGHGMAVALGDLDGDGRLDAVVPTMGGFIDLAGVAPVGFAVRADRSWLNARRRAIWPWSALMEDLDLDGRIDLFTIDQYSADGEDTLGWIDRLMSTQRAEFGGLFDVALLARDGGQLLERRLPYRAFTAPPHEGGFDVAIADVDGDGRPELLLPVATGRPHEADFVLGHLAGVATGHGLTVRLGGRAAASGTRVTLRCGGRAQVRELFGAEGMGAAARLEAHFGCGAAGGFDSLRIEGRAFAPVELPGGPLDRALLVAP